MLQFSDDGERNFASMGMATVFEEKYSLPGAELHFAVGNGNRFARARERHADVRWHVVGAFVVVLEIFIFRHQLVEELFQIASRRRRSVFHRGQTATGVLHKNGNGSIAHAALVDLVLNLIGDFVRAFAACFDCKAVGVNAHLLCDRTQGGGGGNDVELTAKALVS